MAMALKTEQWLKLDLGNQEQRTLDPWWILPQAQTSCRCPCSTASAQESWSPHPLSPWHRKLQLRDISCLLQTNNQPGTWFPLIDYISHLRSLCVNELLSFALSPTRDELMTRIWSLKFNSLMSIFSLKPLSFLTASLGWLRLPSRKAFLEIRIKCITLSKEKSDTCSSREWCKYEHRLWSPLENLLSRSPQHWPLLLRSLPWDPLRGSPRSDRRLVSAPLHSTFDGQIKGCIWGNSLKLETERKS